MSHPHLDTSFISRGTIFLELKFLIFGGPLTTFGHTEQGSHRGSLT